MNDWAQAFVLSEPPSTTWSRADGHLFILIDAPGLLLKRDRVQLTVPDHAPSETAFVLTQTGGSWRYAGVGRWVGGRWHVPAVDSATWQALGGGLPS